MKFIGAAQQEFSSFMDLARTMLDTYCPNWNNPLDQKSYILPPVCSFKNADKSDLDIEKIRIDLEQQKQAGVPQKSLDSAQRPIIDRFSDSGEFVVFYALWALIQDRVAAPFLAIHGLNLKNIERSLHQIFPHAQVDIQKKFEAMMREYDFVLIGPKIGLIVIEVKSSYFTKKKDFAENNKHLPDDIIKGLKQLGSFDPSFFHVCSGSETDQEIGFRKILFTPNLKKHRFESWISNFDEAANEKVKENFNSVSHWFSEDMANQLEHDQKPPLYSLLHLEMEKSGYEIPLEIFESYGLIISGLSSAVILQNEATVSTDKLSTSSAILKDAAALESHNPKRQRLDKNAADVVELESKLVLLTPEQQKALNGPNRQVIIGAPGTGKTIILQAKAAQLLKEGKKVLISAERSYIEKYRKLFGSYGSCTIRETLLWLCYLPKVYHVHRLLMKRGVSAESFDYHSVVSTFMENDLESFDSILIDDTVDGIIPECDTTKKFCLNDLLSLLKIGGRVTKFRSKLLWATCDSYFDDSDYSNYRTLLNEIIHKQTRKYFSTIILDRVMRSSENVFHATYSPEVIQHLAINPIVGHKIHGFTDSVHLCNLSPDDALLEIWNHADSAVKRFREEGFDYDHMAILTAGDRYEYLRRFLWYKFSENGIRVGYANHSRNLLTLDTWHDVSSSEWPVVIYIAMFVAHEERKDETYTRYRACSRATMKLFEIIAEVEISLEAVEFYRGSMNCLFQGCLTLSLNLAKHIIQLWKSAVRGNITRKNPESFQVYLCSLLAFLGNDGLYLLHFQYSAEAEDRASPYYNRIKITNEEELALEHGGKLFRSLVWRDGRTYKVDLKEITGLSKDFLDLLAPTLADDEEQKYLEKHKMAGTMTMDDLEHYCNLGKRHGLVYISVKAKMLKICNIS